jgi:hypothetical protein
VPGKSLFRSQSAQAPATVGRLLLAGAMTPEMMLGHYEQHLETATNRNGRPFDAKTSGPTCTPLGCWPVSLIARRSREI